MHANGRINEAWHRAKPDAPKPTLDQRIEWHLAHARACGCREIPPRLVAELEKRGIVDPAEPSRRSDG